MEGESGKQKFATQASALASPNVNRIEEEKPAGKKEVTEIMKWGGGGQSNGNGAKYPNESNEKVSGKFTTVKVNPKSVEKLDLVCMSNGKGVENKAPFQKKSIFGGHNFCMDPEQVGFRLNLMSGKCDPDLDRTFLGFSISRHTPQMRLVTLNKLLNLIPSSQEQTFIVTAPRKIPFPPLGHEAAVLEKAHKTVSKYLGYLKVSICGDKVLNDKDLTALMDTMIKVGFISTMLEKISMMGFEDRKTACLIWCNFFKRRVSEKKVVAYLEANPKLLLCLMDGYHNQSLALTTGTMLRECFKYEGLAKSILYSEQFYGIFEFLVDTTFDVSTDAFLSFRTLLMSHGKLTETFILEHFDKFFNYFDRLVDCDNYVTKLNSVKLLGSLLLDRRMYGVREEYIDDSSKLKRIILIMCSESPIIQAEAFHCLKVFIINPVPERKVLSIFVKNNDRLLRLIDSIGDGEEDGLGELPDEKAVVVKRLKDIGNKESGSTTSGSISDENSNSGDADVTNQ